jgi:GntR family transcriptional regulator, transcriptional repressor for pyruvate dehydrogenase complex
MAAKLKVISPLGSGQTGSLADQVYEQILTNIIDGQYPVNSKLPTETLLSVSLGVSRPVLRKALKQLRTDDVIHSLQGSGSYVKKRPDPAVLKFSPVGSIADIQRTFEFRMIIESEAAGFAAQRWNDTTLEKMNVSLGALDKSIEDASLGANEDARFHLAVCSAANNNYFYDTISSMTPQTLVGMVLARNLSLMRTHARLQLVQEEHREIMRAIEMRDSDAARRKMKLHIEKARNRVFEGTVHNYIGE